MSLLRKFMRLRIREFIAREVLVLLGLAGIAYLLILTGKNFSHVKWLQDQIKPMPYRMYYLWSKGILGDVFFYIGYPSYLCSKFIIWAFRVGGRRIEGLQEIVEKEEVASSEHISVAKSHHNTKLPHK